MIQYITDIYNYTGYGGKKIKVCLGPNNKYNNDPLTKGQT